MWLLVLLLLVATQKLELRLSKTTARLRCTGADIRPKKKQTKKTIHEPTKEGPLSVQISVKKIVFPRSSTIQDPESIRD